MLDIETRTSISTVTQDLKELDYMGGKRWVGYIDGICFESSGEDHVSVHIIFLAF